MELEERGTRHGIMNDTLVPQKRGVDGPHAQRDGRQQDLAVWYTAFP